MMVAIVETGFLLVVKRACHSKMGILILDSRKVDLSMSAH